jgi:hypothetical protein
MRNMQSIKLKSGFVILTQTYRRYENENYKAQDFCGNV